MLRTVFTRKMEEIYIFSSVSRPTTSLETTFANTCAKTSVGTLQAVGLVAGHDGYLGVFCKFVTGRFVPERGYKYISFPEFLVQPRPLKLFSQSRVLKILWVPSRQSVLLPASTGTLGFLAKSSPVDLYLKEDGSIYFFDRFSSIPAPSNYFSKLVC